MKKRASFTRTIALLACFFAVHDLLAQPFNLEESIQPVELNFTEYKKEGAEKPKGRISINTLIQEKDTMYYFIKGLNMYAPTYFSLNSKEADADIKILLCKENWHTAHRTGEVKGKSLWKADFKTEGDFGIMVVANKKPTKYALLVWTGEEMKVDMPSVFKGADDIKTGPAGGKAGKSNTLLIVAGIVLLGVIGFLVYKLKQKKAGGSTTTA
ncbi:MAG TPA: LPXTG cell wall anchor domain-containing protein [Chitinophagaceae bacterium]|jgi:LPXTG-motif cell wall-anchored protein|nr:LPXTG cell wall anchor domain-containing protein [Chitinophagaceae bacterium]